MLTLSATRQAPYPYLQIVSFFGYTAVSILLSNLITLVMFGEFERYFYFKAVMWQGQPLVNPAKVIPACLLFIGARIMLVWLSTRFAKSRNTHVNAILSEGIYGLYLADFVYLLAYPISVLVGQFTADWYYGPSGATFRLAHIVHTNPILFFLLAGLLCLWIHVRSGRFTKDQFWLRFVLCGVSLCLYIVWVEKFIVRH